MPSVLTTQEFLKAVWPSKGPYIIAYPIINQKGDEVFAHVAANTISDAIDTSRSLCFGKNKNVYFCIHATIEGAKQNPDTGRWRISRKHNNMREGKVFFFDLDVGEGRHKFESREEAIACLERFIFRTGLPRPLVVSSGGGYHVYFVMDEAIPSLEWRPLADRLRWLAAANGLIVDPSRTVDQSSVLRVVGTRNFKHDPPTKVQALSAGEVVNRDAFIAQLTIRTQNYTPIAALAQGMSHIDSDGNLQVTFDGRMTPPDEVFEVCEHMRDFRDNMGVISEPAWHAALGLLKHAENGEELCHQISSGDPRYDEGETQLKMDNWKTSAPSCSKIEQNFGGDACDRCPFKGKGKNPLDIANRVWKLKAAQQNAVALQAGLPPLTPPCKEPNGYAIVNGGVARMVYDKDQDADVQRVVIPYKLFPLANYTAGKGDPGHSEWCVEVPLVGQYSFSFQNADFHDMREFGKSLFGHGLILSSPAALIEAKTYMLHYLNKLQTAIKTDATFDFLGWAHTDETRQQKKSFVLHRRQFVLDKLEWQPAAMSASMRRMDNVIHTGGSFQAHLDAIRFYNRPQYRHVQFMYLAGLGVPFFYITGHHGMVVSACGDSGASKTSTLLAISGQWGNPATYMLSGAPDGMSVNARQDQQHAFANLPFCLDEVTQQSSEWVSNMALSVTQGQNKITMTRDRNIRETRNAVKHSILFASTNTSLVALINAYNAAGEAAIARVLELPFMKGPRHEVVDANRVIRALRANFGWTGPMMLEGLIPQYEQVEQAILAQSDHLVNAWKLRSHERFTGDCCATMYEVAKRCYDLGLHEFDIDEVMVYVQEVLLPRQRGAMMAASEKGNAIEVLSNFITSHFGETVRIDEDGSGNLTGVLHVPNTRQIVCRYDIHLEEIWLLCNEFGKFCSDRKIDSNRIVTQLMDWGVITVKDRRSLTSGIPNYQKMRNWCYVVDLNHPKIKGKVSLTP